MLVCESRGTVDQNLHFDDPSDEVKVTDSCFQRGDQLDGHTSGGLFPLFDCEISSKLALPGLAILLGDVAGHKHQAPNAGKWDERRDRLCQSRQLDLQTLQCFVYRQTVLLKGNCAFAAALHTATQDAVDLAKMVQVVCRFQADELLDRLPSAYLVDPIALHPPCARDRRQQSQVALTQRPKDPCRKARILPRVTQALRPCRLIPPR